MHHGSESAVDPPLAIQDLYHRAKSGEPWATGRLITLIEQGGRTAAAVSSLLPTVTGHLHIVGITGAPGSGKSTLTNLLAKHPAGLSRRTVVLAVDPSSPFSGGAILGDRIRMSDAAADEQVFIRSMATRGQAGGLAAAVFLTLRLFDSLGYELALVETVGVGQVEVDIVRIADTTVVVLAPGWGDDIQTQKAGIMEIADVFVVNKADLDGARNVALSVRNMVAAPASAAPAWKAPVVLTSAGDGSGIEDLVDAIDEHRRHLDTSGDKSYAMQARFSSEVEAQVLLIVRAHLDELLTDLQNSTDRARQDGLDPVATANTVVGRMLSATGAKSDRARLSSSSLGATTRDSLHDPRLPEA